MHYDEPLQIIQRILTKTRYLAGTGADPKTIVDILDETEYLTDILRRQDAETFKLSLAHLGAKFPEHFAQLYETFDTAIDNKQAASMA